MAVTWSQLNAGNAEAGLAAADVLTVQWWLEERRLVYFVKMLWCADLLVAHD